MHRSTDQLAIRAASAAFAGTCGESRVAAVHRFTPAFRNDADGRVEIARMPNGEPAPMHLIAHLPTSWATRLDSDGRVLELIDSIVAGFVRDDRFYTREEAAATV